MELFLLGLLFFLSAFFSSSETAFTSLSKLRMEVKAEEGEKKAKKVISLIKNPDKMLTTILIGNNFVNILLSAIATSQSIKYFGETGVVYATIIVTILILIFSEITPKSIAAVFPEKVSYLFVTPILLLMALLKPVVFVVTKFTTFIIRIISKGEVKKSISTAEIKALVNKGSREGVFQADEMILLNSVLDFKEKDARDAINTPRVDMVSISADASYDEVRKIIQNEQYSRYPVYSGSVENIVGFFYAKDFVYWSDNPEKTVSDYLDKDVLFIPETMEIGVLFRQMKDSHKHLVMVVDEYGGISGLISLEDVIEVMIGHDINDEKDELEEVIRKIDDKTIISLADVRLEKVRQTLPIPFDSEADSLGEFALEELGKIPQKGEEFTYKNCKFTIIEVSKNRIKRIKIQMNEEEAEETE